MALFPTTIETPRLRFEVIRPDSFDPYEMYEHVHADAPNIEEVTQWLNWDPHEHPKETAEFVDYVGKNYDNDEGADYAIYPRDGEDRAGQFAGTTGLSVDWDLRRGTLGAWLRKPFWGRGYSGERAKALAALAFDVLDLDVVGVTHDPENEKSGRAIKKYIGALGGRKEGVIRNDIVMNGEPRDSVRYSVTAEEYREATDGEPEATFEWPDR
ncbi:GNAT family N-acetyltransferase [Natronomonas marina]|jgi:RimJ/RimL family protein N-acetyltransferase|uniref:GNAT family N-acetyltransferase n=1 Tax=Natronomonas marina TaxID=2961939 RepID=UPI0020C9F192|nr:GNAT family protein [Natronomonas marina]